ncbi:unnamed protein product [Didymodactylos carnosus]|uniref:Uncharacterized protein n=1 Tax=Didymodactylos carnosus TaxID=1234261 RepID=A0A815W740_9BILA|nr:unnamed protein product [Didymodactylos carnosus]CAF4405356.1 unnamed protein product [Didymodactylos carnosus]
MFALFFVSLLFLNTGHALECWSDCETGGRFGTPLHIPEGQCQQRTSASNCSVHLSFKYHQQYYAAKFGIFPGSPYDLIFISSDLAYDMLFSCSEDTECPVVYAQSKIDEMVARNYSTTRIYEPLELLIDNPSRNGSIQCHDLRNNVITCSSSELCSSSFDTKKQQIISRQCENDDGGVRVTVFDDDLSPRIDVRCRRNLCDGDMTFNQIKSILAENGLTDANGRTRGAATMAVGTKEMASFVSVTLAFIIALVSYF